MKSTDQFKKNLDLKNIDFFHRTMMLDYASLMIEPFVLRS